MPKVSVIVPVYNTDKYLVKCINSLLKQTLKDIEIIIVDDASTDNSYTIASSFATLFPDKVKLIRQSKNTGVAKARNLGLQYATGDYISFIDSDDYIDENMLEEMYIACEKTSSPISRVNRKMIYKGIDVNFLGRNTTFDTQEVLIPGETDYLYKETPGCTNKLFRRDVIGNREFPENLKWEDYPFTIPLLANSSKIVTVPEPIYFYNMNTNGTTIGDLTNFNPRVLDIFDASDIIGKECLANKTPNEIKEQIEFIQMQNCMQRLRDIVLSNISLKDKRELLTLVSALINKKYGRWQENSIYQQTDKTTLYNLRMKLIESLIEPYDTRLTSEEQLRGKVKEKINDIQKQD